MSRRGMVSAGVAASLVGAGVGAAAVTPSRDARAVARAIADNPNIVTGAAFETIPGGGNSVAISTTSLGQFPTSGDRFAILSTGNSNDILKPNADGFTGTELSPARYRGARDVTTLRIDLNVPATASCLTFGFRFLSEEFPEWVGSQYNDAFIAELDQNTWTAERTQAPYLEAPANFAADLQGRPITVNAIGDLSVSPSEASGTTFDAATRRLRAATPITPGPHRLYLTILDQGDRVFDSAVLIDRLQLSRLTPCTRGVAVDTSQAQPAGALLVSGNRVSIPDSQVFMPIRLAVKPPRVTPARIRTASGARMNVQVADSRGYLVRGARVRVRSVPNGLVRPVQSATDKNGVATLRLRPTRTLDVTRRRVLPLYVCATKRRGTPNSGASDCRLTGVPVGPAR
ncbi:MAG: choice-of-anchor L domain-containing protein [Thermoleophilia bacterium]|nr:choice-of-anchor L domain-containing protein [Thermoleophilia bacterium]